MAELNMLSRLGATMPMGARPSALRPSVRVAVHVEHAVYGNFAFRRAGYELLARSAGCRDAWINDFRTSCCHLGERPMGVVDAPGLFALRLRSGPWVVVRVSPQGEDDHGRPGALAFHGLFISPRDYRRAGADPFAFLPWLRDDWNDNALELRSEQLMVTPSPVEPINDPRVLRIARALRRRRWVALEAAAPIDELARAVWRGLPIRMRMRLSLATWTNGNANRFDLLGVPRLAAVAPDARYVDPDAPPGAWGRYFAPSLEDWDRSGDPSHPVIFVGVENRAR